MNILFFGEFPPDIINGVSISNKINFDILSNSHDVVQIRETCKCNSGFFKRAKTVIYDSFNIFSVCKKNDFDFFYMSLPTSLGGIIKVIVNFLCYSMINNRGRLVLHVHRGDLNEVVCVNKWFRLCIRVIKKFNPLIIALSDKHKQKMSEIFPENNIYVVMNAIEEKSEGVSDIYKIKNRFIYLSNYLKDKGILKLLAAFSLAKKRGLPKSAELHCYGGFLDESIKERVLSFASVDGIFIHNSISGEDKNNVLKNAEVLILPSVNEGQPLSIIEAMYYRCGVICSDVGFVSEMLPEKYQFVLSKEFVMNEEKISEFILTFSSASCSEKKTIIAELADNYSFKFSLKAHASSLNEVFKGENCLC